MYIVFASHDTAAVIACPLSSWTLPYQPLIGALCGSVLSVSLAFSSPGKSFTPCMSTYASFLQLVTAELM